MQGQSKFTTLRLGPATISPPFPTFASGLEIDERYSEDHDSTATRIPAAPSTTRVGDRPLFVGAESRQCTATTMDSLTNPVVQNLVTTSPPQARRRCQSYSAHNPRFCPVIQIDPLGDSPEHMVWHFPRREDSMKSMFHGIT